MKLVKKLWWCWVRIRIAMSVSNERFWSGVRENRPYKDGTGPQRLISEPEFRQKLAAAAESAGSDWWKFRTVRSALLLDVGVRP